MNNGSIVELHVFWNAEASKHPSEILRPVSKERLAVAREHGFVLPNTGN
jgi:hypothetical protein